jgi:type I restriction enzyme S subunit
MTNLLRFSEIVREVDRFVEVQDDKEYRCAGVRLNGRGAFVRELKFGYQVLKKHVQHEVYAGDIVYSTLFANKGAFAVADEGVHGCILSEKFPTFELLTEDIDRNFLTWFFRSGQLEKIARKQVTGMAAFSLSHLSKTKFKRLLVPVPSLKIQKALVSKCEKAEKLVGILSSSIDSSIHYLTRLVPKVAGQAFASLDKLPISQMGDYVTPPAPIDALQEYKQVTVAMNNKGLRLRRKCLGSEIRSPGQCYVRENDLLFSRIDLRNGAIGFVPAELDGAVVTRDFPIFRLQEASQELRKFLSFVFLTDSFKSQVLALSKGTTNRRKLKRNLFLKIEVPTASPTERNSRTLQLTKVDTVATKLLLHYQRQKSLVELVLPSIVAHLFSALISESSDEEIVLTSLQEAVP